MRTARPFPRPEVLSSGGRRIERQKWRAWLDQVLTSVRGCLGNTPLDRIHEAGVAHGVHTVGRTPFPDPDYPARALGAAFPALVKAYVTTSGERRSRLAAVVLSAAEVLDDWMAASAQAEADATWRKWQGGDD